MKEWSHLPNAHHIDWVLKSVKENPALWGAARDEAWDEAWDAVRAKARAEARDEAMSAARDAVWDAARDAVWDAAKDEAWYTAGSSAWAAAWYTAGSSAWDAILSLISYDDCDQFLNMSYERLKVWSVLSEDPRAILLLPMVYVKEKLNEQSLVTSA